MDWAALTNDGAYAGLKNVVVLPRDYPTLADVPFLSFRRNEPWPIFVAHGDVKITTKLEGFGLLVIDGALHLASGRLNWRGLILTAKGLHADKGHLHAHGAVATALSCSATELADGTCRTRLSGDHLGVSYAACDVEAAWAQLLALRPLTPSRHTRLY